MFPLGSFHLKIQVESLTLGFLIGLPIKNKSPTFPIIRWVGFCIVYILCTLYTCKIQNVVHSTEVEMGEIFLSNIFNENGQVPSDIPSDTKNSIRVVH